MMFELRNIPENIQKTIEIFRNIQKTILSITTITYW